MQEESRVSPRAWKRIINDLTRSDLVAYMEAVPFRLELHRRPAENATKCNGA